jgi:MFS superfamily sulfate permease-like transporter
MVEFHTSNVATAKNDILSGVTVALAVVMVSLVADHGVQYLFATVVRVLRKVPRTDALVLVLVSAVTVATDLAVAVVTGVIDFARSRVADHSGLEAIDTLEQRYLSVGKTLHLVHLSEECRKLLRRALIVN